MRGGGGLFEKVLTDFSSSQVILRIVNGDWLKLSQNRLTWCTATHSLHLGIIVKRYTWFSEKMGIDISGWVLLLLGVYDTGRLFLFYFYYFFTYNGVWETKRYNIHHENSPWKSYPIFRLFTNLNF